MLSGFRGLGVTFRGALRRKVTAEYPKEHLPVDERYMGFPALTWDDARDEPFCTGCMVCVRYCPTQCMSAQMKDNPKFVEGVSHRKKIIESFEINLSRCILCGICVDVCNFDAIEMSHEHERSERLRNANRVDLPALALTILGLTVFSTIPSRWGASVSAVIFVLAAFTRQTAVLAPIACVAAMLLNDRRRLIWFLAPYVGMGLTAFIVLNVQTSGQFLLHVVRYNQNELDWWSLRKVLRNEIWFFHRWWIMALIGGWTCWLLAAINSCLSYKLWTVSPVEQYIAGLQQVLFDLGSIRCVNQISPIELCVLDVPHAEHRNLSRLG